MVKIVLGVLLVALGWVRPVWAGDCVAVGGERVEGSLVTPYGGKLEKLPGFCRVAGVLRPSGDSAIGYEVWMPEAGWNGRLLGTGNGGFAGTIYYDQMAAMLRRGYAVAGSDAGHQAGAEDAAFAYHHPEKVVDFGWRAVHGTAVRAKELIAAFYGRAQGKAYFDACSDGGREALMEVQRFPEDYDGVLAGAPANNWAHMVTGGVDVLQVTLRDPAGYIPALKLPAITRASLAACDAADGVKDGVVSDPESCHFDPAVLLCKEGEDSLGCLTAPQVRTLKKLYAGGKDGAGRSIFPGFVPGDEAGAWRGWILGDGPGGGGGGNYANNYFRYMVMGDPAWQALTANVDDALRMAMERTAKAVDATDPDLSAFAARGGKLMMYHGWADPAISPWNSVNYWKSVQAAMGPARADAVMQLYMAPGMEHCAGGPGPNAFGQLSLPAAAGPGTGALDLLQRWVEQGERPQVVLAAKVLPAAAVQAETPGHRAVRARRAAAAAIVRPLCAYPARARYDGVGDPGRAGSFSCVR